MGQHKTGTINVSSGSPVVTGNLTSWSTSVIAVGDAFSVRGDSAIYTVGSIDASTQITLTSSYVGATLSAADYSITTDWTPNFVIGEIFYGDRDWPIHLTVNTIRKIDSILAAKFQTVQSKSIASTSATSIALSTAEYDKSVLYLTGDITTNMTVLLPSTPTGQIWTVFNRTSGAFTVNMGNTAGSSAVEIAQDKQAQVLTFGTVGILRVSADCS